MLSDPYREFRQAAGQIEEKIDLGRAALALAGFDYPSLDVSAYLARIDALAVEVVRQCGSVSGPQCLETVNSVLFRQQGFRGNRTDYYDPKNSFLHEVLDRKTGIPITLSILYMEVAQRVGLSVQGIGFPGHFLVKYLGDGIEVVLDPFQGGEIRTRADLSGMLGRLSGSSVALQEKFLQPAGKKEILRRMLGNLQGIYARTNDLVRLLSVLDLSLILEPGAVERIRDRGGVYLRLECFTQARDDFENYLRLAPDAHDAASIREQLVNLANRVTLVH